MLRPSFQHRDMCPRSRKRRCSAAPRAFTLLEIAVVVLILGIVSAIVIPQISAHDDLNAAAAARTVMADLLYAQNRSITTQKMHYVTFDVPHQQYTLYSSMTPQTILKHPVNLNDYVMTFGQSGSNNIAGKVSLASASFNGQSTIAFDEMGTPYSYSSGLATALSGPGTVVLNCGTYSLTISVARDTGDISVN